MVSDSMVERVARAICVADGKDPDADWRKDGTSMLAVAVQRFLESAGNRLRSFQRRQGLDELEEPELEVLVAREPLHPAGLPVLLR